MNYILFDDQIVRKNLLPLTYTRPVADLRFGIMTMREKWERVLNVKTSTLTEAYLSKKYPLVKADDNILINSSVVPSESLIKEIQALKTNQALVGNVKVIAMRLSLDSLEHMDSMDTEEVKLQTESVCINNVWDLFSKLGETIPVDFEMLTKGRKSQKLSETNRVIGEHPIFIEEGASVEFSTFNTKNGPIYIGKDAEVMEGCTVRGPLAICDHAVLKMGALVYGPTTIGPYSKIGGEVSNSMILGYSSKGHAGFLGNSVLGEWCNLGADTNTSNLKNTYDIVRIWNYAQESFVDTGLQFCGLIMGDHSKSSINTMFNTGTVVGVNVNIFGTGFPRNFVPSFSWGGPSGYKKYNFKKAVEVAKRVYARRDKEFDAVEEAILKAVYVNSI
ncbi:MAG: glucose-1-phosphate thymidylyltransferase [Bacteroidetes bacterium]|nr:MAG: glucose-1-phosphate thymidylyltransferase [Bacteroidota bacterium]